jgi:phenylacetic acid degradation operon negative regulatory protein
VAPTAKSLILELLVATGGAPLPARLAVTACALFDVSENNVRVALVRLASAGLIEAAGQSTYRLAAGATDLAKEVAGWHTAEGRVRSWKGGYVAVHCGALGRTDRGELRRRTRALSILGFAELERGLHVRPDNLKGGVESVRERLYGLGLEREASVFSAGSFEPQVEARVRGLWDGKALTLSYQRTRAELEGWLARASHLEPDVAARESFLLGGRAIRQIVYDPLLPAPLVDVDERRAFVDAMKQMDHEGRRIWRRFFEVSARRSPLARELERHAP